MLKYSPKYMLDLIGKIETRLVAEYGTYEYITLYLSRWQSENGTDYHGDSIYDFYIPSKNNGLSLKETLNSIPEEKLFQIAIDLGLEVPGLIYSVAKIEGITEQNYSMAYKIFAEAVKKSI